MIGPAFQRIFCDGDACQAETEIPLTALVGTSAYTVRHVRDRLLNASWKLEDGRQFCPDCPVPDAPPAPVDICGRRVSAEDARICARPSGHRGGHSLLADPGSPEDERLKALEIRHEFENAEEGHPSPLSGEFHGRACAKPVSPGGSICFRQEGHEGEHQSVHLLGERGI